MLPAPGHRCRANILLCLLCGQTKAKEYAHFLPFVFDEFLLQLSVCVFSWPKSKLHYVKVFILVTIRPGSVINIQSGEIMPQEKFSISLNVLQLQNTTLNTNPVLFFDCPLFLHKKMLHVNFVFCF